MTELKNITGQVFGRLTAISIVAVRGKVTKWNCKCSCGNTKVILLNSLTSGRVKSCGCLKKELLSLTKSKHGMRHSSEYNIWCHLRNRCLSETCRNYKNYGGRGIKVCDRWLNSFENFISDMGQRPTAKHSIDRIDNNGNYEPSNCRWASATTQARNTRSNVMYQLNGLNLCLAEWASRLGVSRSTLDSRINKRGWSLEMALTTGKEKSHTKKALKSLEGR